MAGARVYIPELVIVTWGPIIGRMFQKGSFVKASHDEDATKAEAGAQGDVAVTVSANRMATVTWTLQQLSVTNAELAPFAASNRPRGSPLIIFPMTIKDLSNTTAGVFVFGEQAWIKKAADVERGDEHGPAEWAFQIADCSIFAGGFPG
jgi:hypothetical protein